VGPLAPFTLCIVVARVLSPCFGLATCPHLTKGGDLLLSRGLSQPVDVEQAREPIAVVSVRALVLLTVQRQRRRQCGVSIVNSPIDGRIFSNEGGLVKIKPTISVLVSNLRQKHEF
jgi:hypothetical protein